MKKLTLLALFIPLISFGQKLEVAEMVGYSLINNSYLNSGISNQISFSYYPIKHLSISGCYEYESWAAKNSFGLAADYHLKWFYCGAEIKQLNIPSVTYTDAPSTGYWAGWGTIQYSNPIWGYGLHSGIKHKIIKKLFFNMQIGFVVSNLVGKDALSLYGPASTGAYMYKQTALNETLDYFYLRGGLSYKF